MDGFAAFIDRVAGLVPPFQALIVAFCFIAGVILVIVGIRKAAAYADVETRYAPGQKAGFLTCIVVGTMLISLPSALSASLQTFFQTDTATSASEIFAYAPEMLEPVSHEAAREIVVALLRIVQFIGLLGVVKGLFLLNKAPYAPGNGLVGKGATHIVGGVFAVNIVMFVGMFETLLIG